MKDLKNWKLKFDLLCASFARNESGFIEFEDFIESLLEAQKASFLEMAREEEQFWLNILDGIDIADRLEENMTGGTKAIRLLMEGRLSLTGKLKEI